MEVLMKKNIASVCALSMFFLLMTVTACKTTPPVTPAPAVVEKPAETVVAPSIVETKPVDDALISLRDQMEAARNVCIKYKLDSYKADEWAVAEKTRDSGLASFGVNYEQAEKFFKEAISQYEAIQKDSFNQIVPELEASIVKARQEAIAAGAREYYPEQFALADDAVAQALALREAGKLSEAYDEGQIALMRYQVLLKGMQAIALKQKIDTNQFAQYAPDEAEMALSKYDEAALAYGNADAAALEAITECNRLAEIVVNAGYKAWSEGIVVKVDEIRTLCDSIKAEKSMKVPYAQAKDSYIKGSAFGQMDSWESAYTSYSDAAIAFTNIYQEVTLKRNMADVAIAAAKDQQASSADLALQADKLAPLPENAEGFSEDPIVIESANTPEEAK